MLIFMLLLQLYTHETSGVANLKYFETLSYVGSTTRVKRSSDGTKEIVTHVRFQAFEKKFETILKPDTHLLAEGFTAALVHKDGSSSNIEFDRNRIFSGYLADNPKIRVYAHMENALWMIQIYEKEDIYAVEPAWRLLDRTENPNNDTMVAYRASDFKSDIYNGSKFCGVEDHETKYSIAKPKKVPPRYTFLNKNGNNRTRDKRTVAKDATCLLYLVGDYTFFRGKCDQISSTCLQIMYSFVEFADALYRRTVFANDRYTYTNVGIRMKKIMLYDSFTKPHPAYQNDHFNGNYKWTIYRKLDAFADYLRYMTFGKKFCLNHLLTNYPFPGRILGLAWLGSICKAFENQPKHNAGVTSGSDILEGQISSLQMNLVFAHEIGKMLYSRFICSNIKKTGNIKNYHKVSCGTRQFTDIGHNFGSVHDARTPECSRDDNRGGNFLMWPRSVSGKLTNHNTFSPCSTRRIAMVISEANCLLPRGSITSFCGNGLIDKDEECDAGGFGVLDDDPCCSSLCRLWNGSICSSRNHGCCDDCRVSKKGKRCENKELQECKTESFCDGFHYKCPLPGMVEDWTTCRDHGQCYRGLCRGMCEIKAIREARNLKGCSCPTNENGAACKRCCFEVDRFGQSGPCQVYDNETLMDGKPCYLGRCKDGICQPEMTSTILRLYHYLPSLSHSELGNFMKANLVLIVIVLSLFLWLPPIYFLNKADKLEKIERRKNKKFSMRSRPSVAGNVAGRNSFVPRKAFAASQSYPGRQSYSARPSFTGRNSSFSVPDKKILPKPNSPSARNKGRDSVLTIW